MTLLKLSTIAFLLFTLLSNTVYANNADDYTLQTACAKYESVSDANLSDLLTEYEEDYNLHEECDIQLVELEVINIEGVIND